MGITFIIKFWHYAREQYKLQYNCLALCHTATIHNNWLTLGITKTKKYKKNNNYITIAGVKTIDLVLHHKYSFGFCITYWSTGKYYTRR